VTAGQTNRCTQAIALLSERKTGFVLADKGYDIKRPTAGCSVSTTRTSTNKETASNDASPAQTIPPLHDTI
jgi:hypothetical protein